MELETPPWHSFSLFMRAAALSTAILQFRRRGAFTYEIPPHVGYELYKQLPDLFLQEKFAHGFALR